MKALRERKAGRWTKMVRGLMVVSAIALLFAVAACNNGNNGDNGGGGGVTPPPGGNNGTTPPPEPPPPAGPGIRSMSVLRGPRLPSYQGGLANLEGVIVRIIYDDNSVQEVSLDEGNNRGLFVTEPRRMQNAYMWDGFGDIFTGTTLAVNIGTISANGGLTDGYGAAAFERNVDGEVVTWDHIDTNRAASNREIGRASCRERV